MAGVTGVYNCATKHAYVETGLEPSADGKTAHAQLVEKAIDSDLIRPGDPLIGFSHSPNPSDPSGPYDAKYNSSTLNYAAVGQRSAEAAAPFVDNPKHVYDFSQ